MTVSKDRKKTAAWWALCAAASLLLASCGDLSGGVKKPRGLGKYKIGKPYHVEGQWYYPAVDYAYDETGVASWYGADFHGKRTANGEKFNMHKVSAAHKTLPLPSVVRVINLENGRSLTIRINDRGPFVRGRIIDLSKRAAELLGFADKGTAMVRVQILAEVSRRAALQVGAGDLPDFEPPPPKAAPSVAVAVEALPQTDNAASSPAGNSSGDVSLGAINPATPPFDGMTGAGGGASDSAASQPAESPTFRPEPDVAGEKVTVVPVATQPQIFIQAGAFASYNNANRVRARLSVLGTEVSITQVYVINRPLFRVRLGPLVSVADADRTLAQVIAVGIPEARIIVD